MATATVVLPPMHQSRILTVQKSPTQNYFEHIWTKILGDLSFFVVISFLFIPMSFTTILFMYFGLLHGTLFVLAVCAYNYLESKYHPLGETKRKWEGFITVIGKLWEPFARMKKVQVVKLAGDSAYTPNRKYMFGFHPHGILFLGPSTVVFNVDKYFPGIKVSHLMSSSSFIAPIFRQFCMWIGGIPVTKEAARKVTAEGSSLSLVPGGLAEMLLADPRPRKLIEEELNTAILSGEAPFLDDLSSPLPTSSHPHVKIDNSRPRKTIVLYMQKRKGFVKLAIQLGLDLVPVLTLGELENYHQLRWGLSWRMRVSRMLKIPLIFVYGKIGLVPFSEPMTVLVGEPIRINQEENPSSETIDIIHRKYLARLSNMFEENKAKYGHAESRLIFL